MLGADVSFDYSVAEVTREITGRSVAALVLADIHGEIQRVLTEDDIIELGFDQDGKTVIRRAEA